MTVYEMYLTGKLNPKLTRQSVMLYCEIYSLFLDIRKNMKYNDAIYTVSDLKCTSESTVKKAIVLARKEV